MKEFKSFYSSIDNRKFNTWCNYTKRLDTYGCGCQHDCHYCYAKSLLKFRNFWNPQFPLSASIIEIEEKIKHLSIYETVKLGGMTDCFQPIELKERLTYKTISILNKNKISYLIVTKSDLVSSDEYMKIYDRDLAHFQITITSTSKNTYEKAPTPHKRIVAIEKLQENGFDVCVRLSPFIKDNVDLDILNKIKCKKILIEFLKVNHSIEKWFDIDYSKYTLKYGGYKHLPLETKINLVNQVTGFDEVCVGEYVAEHYHYFRDNVNYNKKDCCNLDKRIFCKPKQGNLFMKIEDSLRLIESEYLRASNLYPNFHSNHEAFAVLKEEMDELWIEIKKCKDTYGNREIKNELVQIGAMVFRYLDNLC